MRVPGLSNRRAFAITAAFALVLDGLVALAFGWCDPVVIASSQEKSALLELIAANYNRTGPRVGTRCVHIDIERKASGTTEQALAFDWNPEIDGKPPVVWIPASTTWIALLKAHRATLGASDLVPGPTPIIIQSPYVIAMPRPMGEALGWPGASIGWADILALAKDPAGWGARGHSEWGAVRLGKTNPIISTSGLHALIGAYWAATGRTPTEADLSDPKVIQFVRDVESSVAHYADAVSKFLDNLLAAPPGRGASLSYVSAIAMEEKQVLDYNDGNPHSLVDDAPRIPPKVQLVAVYPKEGTFMANHPYAILDAPWVNDLERAAAEAFLSHLLSPPVQERFAQAGFRNHAGAPGPRHREEHGVLPHVSSLSLSLLPGAVIEKIQRSWHDLRKRVRVLIAIDVSAPMNESLPGGGVKLALAKLAASEALTGLATDDDVGIWAFAGGLSGAGPYREIAPLGPVGTRREELRSLINALSATGGDTPLYATTRAAVEHVTRSYDPKKIDGVVLLTSGRNRDRDNDLQTLLRELQVQPENRTVRVFGLTYGADTQAVKQIATASRGTSYEAKNAAAIKEAITDLISNF